MAVRRMTALAAGALVVAALGAHGGSWLVERWAAEMVAGAQPLPPPPSSDPDDTSLRGLLRRLRGRDFTGLQQLFTDAAARARGDVREEPGLTVALNAFRIADPTLRPLLDRWVAAFPRSWPPLLVRSGYLESVAGDRRGGGWAKGSTREQTDELHAFLRESMRDASAAIALQPDLADAHGILIGTARRLAGPPACVTIAARGLAQVPASFEIRRRLMTCLQPRWGGSHAAMDAVAEEAQQHVKENPRLAFLRGYADLDRSTTARAKHRLPDALAAIDRALAHGRHWEFLAERADVLRRLGQAAEALRDLDAALVQRPQMPDLLEDRIRVLQTLGRAREVRGVAALLREVDPTTSVGGTVEEPDDARRLAVDGYARYQAGRYGERAERSASRSAPRYRAAGGRGTAARTGRAAPPTPVGAAGAR